MSGWDHVHDLMVEIGELMDLPQVTEYAEQGAWLLVTPAGPVEVGHDDVGGRVLLTLPIGAPEPDERATLYEELLLHNGGLPDPWGVRAGLDGPEGEVVLSLERPLAGLDTSRLRAMLDELGEAASAWRERLLQSPADGTAGGGLDTFGVGVIRG